MGSGFVPSFIAHPTSSYACVHGGLAGTHGDTRKSNGLLGPDKTESQQGLDPCPEPTLHMPWEREGTQNWNVLESPKAVRTVWAGAQGGGRGQSGAHRGRAVVERAAKFSLCPTLPWGPGSHPFPCSPRLPALCWKGPIKLVAAGCVQIGLPQTPSHCLPLCFPGLGSCSLKMSFLLRATHIYDCRTDSSSSK